MKSKSWLAAMTVLLDRVGDSGDLSVIRRWGWTRFATAVRHGATRWYSRIVNAVFDAATDPTRAAPGVGAQRAGALERTRFALADLAHARAETAVVETRMVEVLDELDLTALVTSIPGLSAVGAAAILAETGDPTRFSSARALVKHAGLCPRDNASGAYQGKTGISGRGRPQLWLAAWRAVHAALRNNPVLAARYAHLTGRADNKLTKTQARVAVVGSLLRQLHAVLTTGNAWDLAIAGGGVDLGVKVAAAAA
jgi:transposase